MKAHFFFDTLMLDIDQDEIYLYNFLFKKNANLDNLNALSEHSALWNSTGFVFRDFLLKNTFIYDRRQVRNEEEFYKIIGIVYGNIDYTMDLLWLVKDCSCHINMFSASLEDYTTTISGGRNHRYNASGLMEKVQFTRADFGKVQELALAISNLRANAKDPIHSVHLAQPEEGVYYLKSETHYHEIGKPARLLNFLRSARTTNVLPEKIANYVLIIECLFGHNANQEIQHKIAERLAFYMGKSYEERSDLFKFMKTCYGIRSDFVHGSKVKFNVKQDPVTKEYTTLLDISIRLDNLVREVMLKAYLQDGDKFFDEKKLDDWFNEILFNRVFSQTPPSEAA